MRYPRPNLEGVVDDVAGERRQTSPLILVAVAGARDAAAADRPHVKHVSRRSVKKQFFANLRAGLGRRPTWEPRAWEEGRDNLRCGHAELGLCLSRGVGERIDRSMLLPCWVGIGEDPLSDISVIAIEARCCLLDNHSLSLTTLTAPDQCKDPCSTRLQHLLHQSSGCDHFVHQTLNSRSRLWLIRITVACNRKSHPFSTIRPSRCHSSYHLHSSLCCLVSKRHACLCGGYAASGHPFHS